MNRRQFFRALGTIGAAVATAPFVAEKIVWLQCGQSSVITLPPPSGALTFALMESVAARNYGNSGIKYMVCSQPVKQAYEQLLEGSK